MRDYRRLPPLLRAAGIMSLVALFLLTQTGPPHRLDESPGGAAGLRWL
jgi:hypothetical protein